MYRQGLQQTADAAEDAADERRTSGTTLLTAENVERLASFATHWAIIMHLENDDMVPNMSFFPANGLVHLFEQNKLCRATLLAGFATSSKPKKPVPAAFFRTLDFLLQTVVATGGKYRPINDKEDAKGLPPAGWCRPATVATPDDAPAALAAAGMAADSPTASIVPPADPVRFFYSARSWCLTWAFHVAASTIRVAVAIPAEQIYSQYVAGELSEYAMLVGLQEPRSAVNTNIWVPPALMMPVGALLYMHRSGRPYLPVSLSDMRTMKTNGVQAYMSRPAARPLPLPPHVIEEFRLAAEMAALPPGMDAPSPPPSRQQASGSRGAAGGSAGVSAQGSRRTSNGGTASSSAAPTPRPGGGASAAAPPPVPEQEPDPILNSANWIMPAPFDTPLPKPADADDAAAGGGGAEPVSLVAVSQLHPSLFFAYNEGVQNEFESPPLRLFLGHTGGIGLRTNWWFVDPTSKEVRGPYSPEQMLLSYVAGCCELLEETLVCGTDADVKLPLVPPSAAFVELGTLLKAMDDGGSYNPVSRADCTSTSPLMAQLLPNRVCYTPVGAGEAAAAAAAPASPGQQAPVPAAQQQAPPPTAQQQAPLPAAQQKAPLPPAQPNPPAASSVPKPVTLSSAARPFQPMGIAGGLRPPQAPPGAPPPAQRPAPQGQAPAPGLGPVPGQAYPVPMAPQQVFMAPGAVQPMYQVRTVPGVHMPGAVLQPLGMGHFPPGQPFVAGQPFMGVMGMMGQQQQQQHQQQGYR